MYSSEQSRINAVISYFFLGPFFLLAKSGTPLGDAYVKGHAMKASQIILIMVIELVIYFFLKPYIDYAPLGISITTIALSLIIGSTLFLLMRGAYRAYHGTSSDGVEIGGTAVQFSSLSSVSGVYDVSTEEEKTRILASMIPYLGIWIARKYDHPLMTRGRIIGSTFTFVYIVSLIFTQEGSLLSNMILIAGILTFIIEGIYLFLYGRFITLDILERIPSYREIEAHIVALSKQIGQFVMVSFGKEKSSTYSETYEAALSPRGRGEAGPYFMPAGLIGIPFWNIFTIPSLFIEKYRAYRGLIIQGLIITVIFSYFFFYRQDYSNPILLLALFPIVHILVYGRDPSTESPIIGLIPRIYELFRAKKSSIQTEKHTVTESFQYTIDSDIPSSPPSKA